METAYTIVTPYVTIPQYRVNKTKQHTHHLDLPAPRSHQGISPWLST